MTLATHRIDTRLPHAGMSREERQAAGITDALIRLSVGIEDTRALIDDIENALGE